MKIAIKIVAILTLIWVVSACNTATNPPEKNDSKQVSEEYMKITKEQIDYLGITILSA